ncbi:MAG: protein-tyrosine phosphatase family protein [Arenicellales bacterium]|nr:protein-tyrosine phosphatase family protein [Arenicellales bacterium]MDP6854066.1 protein-tyrosine phosphatase family protein [Arenicellales bacterium]MDP6947463.1 protein-tyrosine phosphatase family protein [Arenicellales bacterium]
MPVQLFGEPLGIDAVAVSGGGLIGMCCCPGRAVAHGLGGLHSRALSEDLAIISCWQPDLVVSLVEAYEFSLLGVPALPDRLREQFCWQHWPVPDLAAPANQAPTRQWLQGDLLVRLQQGQRILLHCAAGLGRTGTVAAALLVFSGESAASAIARVRRARPGTVESVAQADYLYTLDDGPIPD